MLTFVAFVIDHADVVILGVATRIEGAQALCQRYGAHQPLPQTAERMWDLDYGGYSYRIREVEVVP